MCMASLNRRSNQRAVRRRSQPHPLTSSILKELNSLTFQQRRNALILGLFLISLLSPLPRHQSSPTLQPLQLNIAPPLSFLDPPSVENYPLPLNPSISFVYLDFKIAKYHCLLYSLFYFYSTCSYMYILTIMTVLTQLLNYTVLQSRLRIKRQTWTLTIFFIRTYPSVVVLILNQESPSCSKEHDLSF